MRQATALTTETTGLASFNRTERRRKVSIGTMRAGWRAFKKAHPEFEKEKAFKADLGPNLDKFEKVYASWGKQQESSSKDFGNVFNAWKTISAIMKGYEAATTYKNLADFKALQKDVENLWGHLQNLEEHQDDLIRELSK
jgi:hypothetical protein